MRGQHLRALQGGPVRAIFAVLCLASAQGCVSTERAMPAQATLLPNAQIFSRDTPVKGIAVNAIYGWQDDVEGFDVGLLNETGTHSGFGAGLVNVSREDASGFQAGMSNAVEGSMVGMQVGSSNQVYGDLHGVQVGLGNASGGGRGLQLGFLNHTKSMKGLQIGFININENGFLPFFPVINFSF